MNVTQYIIAREDLLERLGVGFMSAQIGHAAVAPIARTLSHSTDSKCIASLFDTATLNWINGKVLKKILGVESEEELKYVASGLTTAGFRYEDVRESSLNGGLTCIGLYPILANRRPPCLETLLLYGQKPFFEARIDGKKVSPEIITFSPFDLNASCKRARTPFSLEVDGHTYWNNFEKPWNQLSRERKASYPSEYCHKWANEILVGLLPRDSKQQFYISSVDEICRKKGNVIVTGKGNYA